jgi:hypothetical protein
MLSSFACSLLSIFHEPGKYFGTLNIMEDAVSVCFAKNTSSPSEKRKWPLLSACHTMRFVESYVLPVLYVSSYDRMRWPNTWICSRYAII